jgi:hypothetical protein
MTKSYVFSLPKDLLLHRWGKLTATQRPWFPAHSAWGRDSLLVTPALIVHGRGNVRSCGEKIVMFCQMSRSVKMLRRGHWWGCFGVPLSWDSAVLVHWSLGWSATWNWHPTFHSLDCRPPCLSCFHSFSKKGDRKETKAGCDRGLVNW